MQRKFIFWLVLVSFVANMVLPYQAYTQVITPDAMNRVSTSHLLFMSRPFIPLTIKGLKLYANDPFKFDFMIDEGNSVYSDSQLKVEAQRLINYFLVSLTIPEDELWVNLSPYEKDRIITPELGSTGMGEDMLSQDYILKQLASSLTFPESNTGNAYWQSIQGRDAIHRVRDENNFQKVWIVPDKAVVYTDTDKAYVGEATLKVMVEEDYVAGRFDTSRSLSAKRIETNGALSDRATQAFKTHILPALTKEVNTGKHFAQLRQIYKSLILAAWFKKHLKENIINKLYADQKKMNGVDTADPQITEKIYNQYLETCKNGVYNYVKRERTLNKITRRQYFSGGVELPVTRELVEANLASLPISARALVEGHTGIVHAMADDAGAPGYKTPSPKIGKDGRYKGLFVPRDWGAEVHIDYGLKGDALRRVLGHESFHTIMHVLRLEDHDGYIRAIDENTEEQLAVLYEDAFLGKVVDIPVDLMFAVILIENALNEKLENHKQSLAESLFAYIQDISDRDLCRPEILGQRLSSLGVKVMFIGSAHEFMEKIKRRADEGSVRAMASVSETPVAGQFDIDVLLAEVKALGIAQADRKKKSTLRKRAADIIIAAGQENPEDILQHIPELFLYTGGAAIRDIVNSILKIRPDLVLQYAPKWCYCVDKKEAIDILWSAVRRKPGAATRLANEWVPCYSDLWNSDLRRKNNPLVEDLLLVAVERDHVSAKASRPVWRGYIRGEVDVSRLTAIEQRRGADTAEMDRVGGINFNRDKLKIEEKGRGAGYKENINVPLPDLKNFTGFTFRIIGIERKTR